jgi:hypothetical protein
VPAKSAAAIVCTGASPQRCRRSYIPSNYRSGEGGQCFFFGVEFEVVEGCLKKGLQYLVVKAARTIEVLEERGVGLAAPKVHIGDLKVAPNCFFAATPPPRHNHDGDDQKPLLR